MTNLYHHELLDRLYLITDMYNDYILEHNSDNILSKKEKETMCKSLWDQYQLVAKRMDDMEWANSNICCGTYSDIQYMGGNNATDYNEICMWLDKNLKDYAGETVQTFTQQLRKQFDIEFVNISDIQPDNILMQFTYNGIEYKCTIDYRPC